MVPSVSFWAYSPLVRLPRRGHQGCADGSESLSGGLTVQRPRDHTCLALDTERSGAGNPSRFPPSRPRKRQFGGTVSQRMESRARGGTTRPGDPNHLPEFCCFSTSLLNNLLWRTGKPCRIKAVALRTGSFNEFTEDPAGTFTFIFYHAQHVPAALQHLEKSLK